MAKVGQEELSRRMGQSITFIVMIERGTRRLDVVEFMRLAECPEVPPRDLFGQFLERIEKQTK